MSLTILHRPDTAGAQSLYSEKGSTRGLVAPSSNIEAGFASSSTSITTTIPAVKHESTLFNFEHFRTTEQAPLPELPAPSFSFTYFRFQSFTVYHRIFSIVLAANLAAFIVIIYSGTTTATLLRSAVINFMACGLARVSYFNVIAYRIACSLPRSAPLALRRAAAKVSHYGGVHSGTGIAAICWFMAYLGYSVRDILHAGGWSAPRTSIVVMIISYVILLLLIILLAGAYPMFRFMKHDVFEFSHRILSWTILTLVWIAYMLASRYLADVHHNSLNSTVAKDPTFYFLIVMTFSIASPWLTLRPVHVNSEPLSTHAIRLHFNYTTTLLSQGVSIARSPFKDWHSFAAIPDENGFSLVVSKAGDWTSDVIANPPTRLWKRAVPAYGFGRTVTLFNRILLLAAGSGIGPCLSMLSEGSRPPTHLIWQTRNPIRTYGSKILEEVAELDSNALVIDTDKHGRQDMMSVAWAMYKQCGAEAIFIVSNPKVTYEIVYGFEARGVPAYGAIFDS